MKISNIEKKDEIYYVAKSPNIIQRLFGVKEKVERYKTYGEVFKYFNQFKAFYDSNGKQVRLTDDMCEVLNNFDRRF